MNRYTSAATLFAMLAMSVPMVSQAQDPATVYKQIQALSSKGQRAQAVELCDKVLNAYGSGKSRLSAQFAYMMPYFLWQKGTLLSAQKDYKGAYEAFKTLHTTDKYKAKNLIAAAAEKTETAEGYAPYLTMALFQMGYVRFMDAQASGDQALYEDAIRSLEGYLKLLRAGKVSATEKKQKLDGRVAFLLMQSNLLKAQPDFKKAEEYLAASGNSKEKLPDDMAMTGLATIISIGLKQPEYISWASRVINSNPSTYNLSPERAGRQAHIFINSGLQAATIATKALRAGDMDTALSAAQASSTIFSLVPEVGDVRSAAEANIAALGKYEKPVPDPVLGLRLSLSDQKNLKKAFDKYVKDNSQLEGFATLSIANTAYSFGSARLAKAGFQVLADRYPRLSQTRKGEEPKSMADTITYQLAQLSRMTGDEEQAVKLEKKLQSTGSEVGSKNIKFNEMARLVQAGEWEAAIPVADEVIETFKDDKAGQEYPTAFFSKVAALYKLGRYEEVTQQGTALLDSGCLEPNAKLDEKQVRKYGSQACFFVLDSYMRLAKANRENLDKALATFERFVKEYPSTDLAENPLIINAYYNAVNTLLMRQGNGNDDAKAEDIARALELSKVLVDTWPEHALCVSAQLLRGNILVASEDESVKPEGMLAYEACATAGLKLPDGKGKGEAANALYCLTSYGLEIPREGEDEAARDARLKGYSDLYWNQADFEGNPTALVMATLELKRANRGKDAAAFNAALKRAEEVISREANYSLANNRIDPDMEAAINDYAAAYIDGNKLHNGKELTLQEKTDKFTNFPGVVDADKYTRAILRMALINAMSSELAAAEGADKRNKLNQDIERTFREMTNTFQPADLTSFICVNVGNYLVDYVSRFDNPASKTEELAQAEAYFSETISRGKEQVEAARLGLANARALTGDAAKQAEALKEYNTLSQIRDRAVAGPALVGATKLYMAMGDANKAVETASKFVNDRSNQAGRLDMLMLLGKAYDQAGNQKDALLTYMNLYNQNLGNVTYSAPACLAMTEIMWKRNTPATGDRLKNDFKQSDRWQAWNTARDYVDKLRRSGFEEKMSRADKDLFQKVVQAVARYESDAAVQKEEKERRDFRARVKGSKK